MMVDDFGKDYSIFTNLMEATIVLCGDAVEQIDTN